MHSSDRNRVLRGLGMGIGSLLLLSGAVFASQSGSRGDDQIQADSSASQEASEAAVPSGSPEVDAFQGGEVEDASESPEASPEDTAGDQQGQDEQGQDGQGQDEQGDSASPSADESQDEQGDSEDSGDGSSQDEGDSSGSGSDDSGHDGSGSGDSGGDD
jgi:hypothetical protein